MKEYYIDSKQIGGALKSLRLANHLTQNELGEILGYSERQCSEESTPAAPSQSTRRLLCASHTGRSSD